MRRRENRKVGSRAYPSIRYLKDRLVGYPPSETHGSLRVRYGPLLIQGTSQVLPWRIEQRYGNRMTPGEGQAFVIVRDANAQPDSATGQVMMSLESFAQILEWAFGADPGMFTRPMHHRKDSDG